MKVVSVVMQKGGTAKSTLARHFAVAATRDGYRVAVVDCDQQGTLREWAVARAGVAPPVIPETSTQRKYVEATLRRLRDEGVEVVILDTPGTFEGAYTGNAVALSDFVVVPCRPSGEDTDAFWQTEARVREAGRPFGAVVTQAPTNTPRPVAELMQLFRDSGIEVCPAALHVRGFVPATWSTGSTVFETEATTGPDRRSVDELAAIWAWVAGKAGLARREAA